MNLRFIMSFLYITVVLLIHMKDSGVGASKYEFPTDGRTWDNSTISDSNVNIVARYKRQEHTKLIDTECKKYINRLCDSLPDHSDLFVLECIQSFKVSELATIDDGCQHQIWLHTMQLLDDDNLRAITKSVCGNVLDMCQKYPGHLLPCMIDNREMIRSDACRALIQRLEWVAFSDFKALSKQFVNNCTEDVIKLKCGRLQLLDAHGHADEGLSQGRTLSCLQENVEQLSRECQKQVFRLSELQADDIRLDRQLYLACVEDHQRFCSDVPRGSGKIYKCLMQHKLDRTMTKECQEHLTWRQKLIAQDYRVSRGLARACREDIRTYRCRRLLSEDKEIRLAQILLCLEGVLRNGTKVSPDCQVEMVEHRKILMEDYRLSPEIVSSCPEDISKFCKGLEVGGKTIHCLMERTRMKKRKERVSISCQRALEVLVKQADAGEDWRVDPVLREACKPVVDSACQDIRGGDARVMSCLMEKLGSDHMTDACETALLQIQYFVARDFKLDPQLYRECHEDAVRFCHAKRAWVDLDGQQDPERGPLILPCLYRYAYHPDDTMKLRSACLEEIRRVMRQRAISVDLQPEVEEVCLEDIAANCFEKTGKGEEMVCLQDRLETLSPACKVAVSNFTEIQAEHVELNPIIMSYCKKMMERHCEAELEADKDEGDIMECLIEHKNEPDMRASYKCRAAVEHFQLISLKNYHFTYKFKEACRSHVMRFCPSSKSKSEVIACLSEIVRNDTLRETKHSISKECRQQLRSQLFQQRENIDFNPKLKEACIEDIKKYCDNVYHGSAQVLECLQQNKAHLSKICHRMIFNVERQEMVDNSVDYVLITTCQQMIRQFCHQEDQSKALVCLKRYKDDPTFDPKCKVIVVRRMIEQSTDYRFNPLLQKGCRMDISKFCSSIVAVEPPDKELDGIVVKCLKNKFRERKLSPDCERQMTIILREAALNYQLNPLLESMCRSDIKELCANLLETPDGAGAVEECLKNAFNKRQIRQKECQVEVANIIEEAKADIHVDPLLHEACSIDLSKYCSDIPQGSGRHIQCLQAKLTDAKQPLQPDCHAMLSKRFEMFRYAAEVVAPETFEELYSTVSRSPSRKYFLILAFSMVGIIFIMGLFCGRVTRRTLMMKNK
ncbi:Golgi apparatus protein 1 [Anabrus simplex]|uniref:Golgi apparatus protein 1 n=1 Tax=Anabrus simplex TaxID=316456 RepID=UPI0034DD7AE1